MQFQVPQFIETEDKVVGPFTLRQFAYVGVAGVLSAMLYFAFQTWLFAIGAFILFAAAFAFAFVKIEGRPFVNVVLSAANFYWKPQTYVWQPEHNVIKPEQHHEAEANKSALEEIIAQSAAKPRATAHIDVEPVETIKKEPATEVKLAARETVSAGSALHKAWEEVQTGTPSAKKNSDKQFLEKKMAERYQIFQRIAGDRQGAKRIDYR